MAAAVALVTVSVAGCSIGGPTPSPSPAGGGVATVAVWQAPQSFLEAGVTGGATFAYVIDAPVQEGLLWYRSTQQTQSAGGPADYWSPDLATEVPTLANGDVRTSGCATAHATMCVTWKLRSGVRWDDGSAFTSHDVCDTFRFHWLDYGAKGKTNPTSDVATAGWDQVLGCTETDRATAVVDFATQYGPYLTLGSGVYGIMPAAVLDPALAAATDLQKLPLTLDLRSGSGNPQAFHGTATAAALMDGTGPFVFQALDPGKRVTLVQNRDYWNHGDAPHLDSIMFDYEGDLATAVTNVMSGAVTVGFDLRLANLAALVHAAGGGNPLLRVDTVREPGVEKLDLNLCAAAGGLCDNPAADESMYTADPVVRRAILMAIDRRAIIAAVAPGRTVVPRDSWVYLGASYVTASGIAQTGFDPAAANRMLDQAGYHRDSRCGAASGGLAGRAWKDGSCLVVNLGTTSDDPVRVRIESMVQTDLAAVGIGVPSPFTPNVPAPAFFSGYADGGPLATHAFDMALYALTLSEPGEPSTLAVSYHGDCGGGCPAESEIPSAGNPGAGLNVTGLTDKELDAALDKAVTTVDPALRADAYAQAQQRLAALLPEIPLFQQVAVNTYSTQLRGVSANELVWDYDTAAWYCTGGSCQA